MKWDVLTSKPELEEGMSFREIFIPTEDTEMCMFFMNTIATHSFNFLLLGETGTSKTVCMKKFINILPVDNWDKGSMIFSATTNST